MKETYREDSKIEIELDKHDLEDLIKYGKLKCSKINIILVDKE